MGVCSLQRPEREQQWSPWKPEHCSDQITTQRYLWVGGPPEQSWSWHQSWGPQSGPFACSATPAGTGSPWTPPLDSEEAKESGGLYVLVCRGCWWSHSSEEAQTPLRSSNWSRNPEPKTTCSSVELYRFDNPTLQQVWRLLLQSNLIRCSQIRVQWGFLPAGEVIALLCACSLKADLTLMQISTGEGRGVSVPCHWRRALYPECASSAPRVQFQQSTGSPRPAVGQPRPPRTEPCAWGSPANTRDTVQVTSDPTPPKSSPSVVICFNQEVVLEQVYAFKQPSFSRL